MPQLLDDAGIPDLVVSAYVTTVLRPTGMAYASMMNHVRGIERGHRMLAQRGIDLDQRLATGTFLTRDELTSLGRACLHRDDGQGLIGGETAGFYYSAFVAFMLWLLEPIVVRADPDTRNMLRKERDRFEKLANTKKPVATAGAANPGERYGLSPEQRELFVQVIRPDHPDNPFTTKLRVRNYALMLLAYHLGPRAGEVLSLKRPQYDGRSAERSITIERRPFDPEDTRSEPALVKTEGRTLPLGDEIGDAMDVWLKQRNGATNGRPNFPQSVRKTGYIFVSTKGNPLSLRQLRRLFETLERASPALDGISQDVVRHDDSERWIEEDERTGRERA